MPYMSCNGKTMSRYSTTDEAKACKKKEAELKAKTVEECKANPECSIHREKNFAEGVALSFIMVVFAVFLIALFRSLFKEEISEEDNQN